MSTMQIDSGAPRPANAAPWIDAILVGLLTLTAALLFAGFDLTESMFESTRTWEHLQLDELPATLLVLAAGLAWFAWRRHREASSELVLRQQAEMQLASLLLDHRRLSEQHVNLQESERKALARELHDELGQYLNAIKTDAVTIQSKSAEETISTRAATAIIAHCDHLQCVLRGLIGWLRPVGLDVLGLRAALEYHLEAAQQRTPDLEFSMALEGELDSLDEQVSLAIYRLIQEGLTNISRHARARHVEVEVCRETSDADVDQVHVSLSDDGCGAELAAKSAGLGLIGMRERVQMLRGELQITTAPGQGFRIEARIPAYDSTSHE